MSIEFKVEPYKSIGEYVFGMSRDAMKELIGEPVSSSTYGYPVSDRSLDDYGFLYVLCDNKGFFEAMEIYPEYTEDAIVLTYGENKVEISTDIDSTISAFEKISDDFIWDEDSYSSQNLGISVFCPDDQIENILIYDQHYFD